MSHPLRIDQLSREEKQLIQRDLIRLGFLKEHLPSGDRADDGIWGPVTDEAYSTYWTTRPSVEISVPIVAPAPVRPWWLSRGIWGAILTLVAAAAGFAGMGFDATAATDALMPILEAVPLVLAAIGGLMSWWGRKHAKAPIDPTLLARVGTHDIRLPGGVRRDSVPPRSDTGYKDPRGLFGD